MKNTILFDMDGVLVDSRPAMEAAWEYIQNTYRIKSQFSDYVEHVGKPFEIILKKLHIEKELHSDIKKSYGEETMRQVGKVKLYKGISYLTKVLHQKGCKIGIVTSKEYYRADYLADKLMLVKHILVTPEMTRHGKPSGEPLEYAMKMLGSNQEECIYIGDMLSDYESAKNAGIDYLHANWGYGNLNTDKVIQAEFPEEILVYLELDKYCSTSAKSSGVSTDIEGVSSKRPLRGNE